MPPLTKPAVRALRLNRKVAMMSLLPAPYLLSVLAFNHCLPADAFLRHAGNPP